jgi:hypothetical protein
MVQAISVARKSEATKPLTPPNFGFDDLQKQPDPQDSIIQAGIGQLLAGIGLSGQIQILLSRSLFQSSKGFLGV